jgi:hypothetical protein
MRTDQPEAIPSPQDGAYVTGDNCETRDWADNEKVADLTRALGKGNSTISAFASSCPKPETQVGRASIPFHEQHGFYLSKSPGPGIVKFTAIRLVNRLSV